MSLSPQRQRMKERAEARQRAKAAPRDYRKLTQSEKRLGKLQGRLNNVELWLDHWKVGSPEHVEEAHKRDRILAEMARLREGKS